MKHTISISVLALLMLPTIASGQGTAKPLPNAPSSHSSADGSGDISEIGQRAADSPSSSVAIAPVSVQPAPTIRAGIGIGGKFRYYLTETYFNPSVFTAPAFRAGVRMANPPGKGCLLYTSPSPRDLSTSRMPSSA